jgi:hypothetical protein
MQSRKEECLVNMCSPKRVARFRSSFYAASFYFRDWCVLSSGLYLGKLLLVWRRESNWLRTKWKKPPDARRLDGIGIAVNFLPERLISRARYYKTILENKGDLTCKLEFLIILTWIISANISRCNKHRIQMQRMYRTTLKMDYKPDLLGIEW